MASHLPIGGLIELTPTGGSKLSFTDAQVVFDSGSYTETGTDIQETVVNGDIERYRLAVEYSVSFRVWGNVTDDFSEVLKNNTLCTIYEDDGTTPVAGTTAFYGALTAAYDASSNTTTITVTGNTTMVPEA